MTWSNPNERRRRSRGARDQRQRKLRRGGTACPMKPDWLRAFVLALAAAFAATPLAIAVAGRIDFHDRPVGYKAHARPTPYLGGAAVLGGFLVAAAFLQGEFARLSPIVVCSCALWAIGTFDDRVGLPASPRVAAECLAAIALWSTGLGWNVFPGNGVDLALTIVWVVGLVNAFNLIDNMDGAAATLAAVHRWRSVRSRCSRGTCRLQSSFSAWREPASVSCPTTSPRRPASSSVTAGACLSVSWWRHRSWRCLWRATSGLSTS